MKKETLWCLGIAAFISIVAILAIFKCSQPVYGHIESDQMQIQTTAESSQNDSLAAMPRNKVGIFGDEEYTPGNQYKNVPEIFPPVIPRNLPTAVLILWRETHRMDGAITNLQTQVNAITNAIPFIEKDLPAITNALPIVTNCVTVVSNVTTVVTNLQVEVITIHRTVTNLVELMDTKLTSDVEALTNDANFVTSVHLVTPMVDTQKLEAKVNQHDVGLEIMTNTVLKADMDLTELKAAVSNIVEGAKIMLANQQTNLLSSVRNPIAIKKEDN